LVGATRSSCALILTSRTRFPKLYFHDPKTGLFEQVPNGGLLIYYRAYPAAVCRRMVWADCLPENRGDLDKANGGPGLKVRLSIAM
jgi:hypothetical protein